MLNNIEVVSGTLPDADQVGTERTKGLFLIQGRQGIPQRDGKPAGVVVMSTTVDNDTGRSFHLRSYYKLIPPEFSIVHFPTTEDVAGDPGFISYVLSQVSGYVATGGEDLDPAGPFLKTRTSDPGAQEFGGYKPLRDRTEHEIFRAIDELPHPPLEIDICRGFQARVAYESPHAIVNVSPNHKPEKGQLLAYHPVLVFDNSNARIKLGRSKLRRVPSYHHLGVKELPSEMRRIGYIAHTVHPADGNLEGFLQTDEEGHITKIGTQWHPEKYDKSSSEGASVRDWFYRNQREHHRRRGSGDTLSPRQVVYMS